MPAARPTPPRGAAYWWCFAVILLASAVSTFGAVTRVIDGGLEDANALFLASRAVAILVVALIVPLFPADGALLALAVVTVIVQGIDVFVFAVQEDWGLAAGAAVFCLVSIVTASFLARTDRVRGGA